MAYDVDFDDLDYGDETRRNGDYVGLPHDESTDGVPEGQAVAFDGTKLVAASGDTDPVVGVLFTYQYYTDNSGGETVDQDANATVKTHGTVKAEVESDVSAGDSLIVGATTNGVFDTEATQSQDSDFIALSDARAQDRDDGSTAHYAEVLIR